MPQLVRADGDPSAGLPNADTSIPTGMDQACGNASGMVAVPRQGPRGTCHNILESPCIPSFSVPYMPKCLE